jgi:hypothetical protein
VIALALMAAAQRRHRGGLDEAGKLLDAARPALHELDSFEAHGRWLCKRGHVALAGGSSAETLLREAEQRASGLELSDEGMRGKALARLRRAQAAFEAGRPLQRGECAEDLPEALRRRLSARAAAH